MFQCLNVINECLRKAPKTTSKHPLPFQTPQCTRRTQTNDIREIKDFHSHLLEKEEMESMEKAIHKRRKISPKSIRKKSSKVSSMTQGT